MASQANTFMADDVKPEVIKKTQDVLGKYIKRPPLTEKLLKKPPFRFLHDIITNVIQETGFLNGLLTEEELNHENIKDRDGKVAFLQKVIDAVKGITGARLTVRPTKIVAGHEATKTNELLQAIGKALDKKLRSNDYFAQQKKSKQTPNSSSKEETVKSDTPSSSKSSLQPKRHSQSKVKLRESSKDKKKTSESPVESAKYSKPVTDVDVPENKEEAVPVNVVDIFTSPIKAENMEDQPQPTPDTLVSVPVPEPEENPPQHVPAPLPQENISQDSEEINEINVTVQKAPVNVKEEHEIVRPQSAHANRRKSARVANTKVTKSDASAPHQELLSKKNLPKFTAPEILGSKPMAGESIMEPSVARVSSSHAKIGLRPTSAHPAAPRLRDRGEIITTEEVKPVTGKVNVITENDPLKEQEEYENFVVVETPPVLLMEDQPLTDASNSLVQPSEEGQHGHLVAQILETQKELEDDAQRSLNIQDVQHKRVEIEWEAGRHRERELANKDIERVRASIQTVTRAANPLGKLMDFLQEDVDAMQHELNMWKETNNQLRLQLLEEQSLTEQSIEPLKAHLQQLQQGITEKLDQISALKANIIKNESKIHQLLLSGSQRD